MQHWLVIVNPEAGSSDQISDLTTRLAPLGDITLQTTTAPGEARQYARAGVGAYDVILAAGGDGTINEVINGIAPDFSAVTFGVLPLGTGNDFARSINMPDDLPGAITALAARRVRAIDVVRADSDHTRYFINVSAGGFSGQLDENLTDDIKDTWGPLAYLRTAVTTLPDLTNYHTLFSFDDQPAEEIPCYNVVVANGRFAAGGIPVAPEAQLNDGLLDVFVVPVAPVPQLMLRLPGLMRGTHTDDDLLVFRRARTLRVQATPGMWFNTDGELVGKEPVTFTVLPRVLNVLYGFPDES